MNSNFTLIRMVYRCNKCGVEIVDEFNTYDNEIDERLSEHFVKEHIFKLDATRKNELV